MISNDHIEKLQGATVYDESGEKIGKAGQVYLDDTSGTPTWITVNTGLFGTSESFVPVEGTRFDGNDRIDVSYSKAKIKDAPNMNADRHIEPGEEQALYEYYGLSYGGGHGGELTGTAGMHGDASSEHDTSGRHASGHDTSGRTTDEAMTRSEEHVRAGTERVETGRARLRKYVTTEQQTVTVPVEREEVRVEREPITDANRDAALDGPDISEEEHEVVLTEERPVVTKEAVPVERVSLAKETVTDEKTVTEDVRKEHIDLDADSEVDADRHGR